MPRTKRNHAYLKYGWALLVLLICMCTAFISGSFVQAQGAWKTTNIGGIHYAVERSTLHPNRWRRDLQQTYDCNTNCKVGFDNRMSAVHLRYKWAQINPRAGRYNFEDLGAVLDTLHASNKMATLVIMGGKYTPSWVIDAGATHLPIPAKTSDAFSQPFVPAPWDPVYLREYARVHAALAAYLKRSEARYKTVVLVKNGALTIHSGETRLMPAKAFKLDASQNVAKALCTGWAQVGYSENRLLGALRMSNAAIADAFRDQYLGLAYVGGFTRFPTVTAQGNCVANGKNKTMSKLIKQMVKTYGKRSVINNTVLTPKIGNPPIMNWVKRNGGRIAFQVNRQQVGCHENVKGQCSEQLFAQTLQTAVAAGAVFVEVHDGNIKRYKDMLPQIDGQLSQNWFRSK